MWPKRKLVALMSTLLQGILLRVGRSIISAWYHTWVHYVLGFPHLAAHLFVQNLSLSRALSLSSKRAHLQQFD